MKKFIVLILGMILGYLGNAQSEIPNGGFDYFTEYESGFFPGIHYLLPDEWTEGIIPNLFGRLYNGEGFFYEYTEPDANGSALTIRRGVPGQLQAPYNNGFIRFECSDVPEKIVGRYKFSQSDLVGIVDTLRIVSYFENVTDTLPVSALHFREFPDIAVILDITDATDDFMLFELDMTPFQGIDVDYLSIEFVMLTGANDQLNPGFSYAVIDDLSLLYAPLSVENEATKPFVVYPNPVTNNLYIKNIKKDDNISFVKLTDTSGRQVLYKDCTALTIEKIPVVNLSNGMYMLTVITQSGEYYEKIIKRN